MSTEMTSKFVSQQIHMYFGLSILIFGVIGGILNVIIFTSLKTFRETTCAFYLTVASLVNIGQLSTALLVRVLSEGFCIDPRKISWFCKIHIYFAQWCVFVSLTSICFATIDQFLSMSIYRHLSNMKLAQRYILIACILWGTHGILTLIYWDVHSGICMIINSNFALYVSRFHFPVLFGCLPISVMSTFSLLAFFSTRSLASRQVNIVRRSRDRQLTAMTLVHVGFVIITILPYTIYFIYSLNQWTTNSEQIARNNLNYGIIILIDYLSYTGPFYIYCCVSERFRKQLVHVLVKGCTNRWGHWGNNQIAVTLKTTVDSQPTRTKRISLAIISIH